MPTFRSQNAVARATKRLLSIVRNAFLTVIGLAAMVVVFGQTVAPTPDHAIVYPDFAESKYFVSPECAEDRYYAAIQLGVLKPTTAGELRKALKARSHPDCGMTDESTVIRMILSSLKVWPRAQRWNADGTWNW